VVCVTHHTLRPIEEEEEDFLIDSEVHCEELIPLWRFEPAKVNSIKLAYDPRRSNGRPVAACTFNRLNHYASSPGNRAYCYAELGRFFPSGGQSLSTILATAREETAEFCVIH